MVVVIENLGQFKEALKAAGDKLVVVDFTATWCGPCKMIGPFFHSLSEDPENANVVFLKVDVDDAEDVASECKISAMPTFVFYKNETNIYSFSGANKEKLAEEIKKHR